jgi:hypothetical protein
MTSTVPDATGRLRAARAPSRWHEASGAAVFFRAPVVRPAPICLYSTIRQIGGFSWKQFGAGCPTLWM